jgi:RNA polymerase sigma factor (sigma-70 family)
MGWQRGPTPDRSPSVRRNMPFQTSPLAEFLARERSRLLHFVRKRLFRVCEMDVEDMVSDVMVGLLQRANLVGEIENVAAYVYRALENRIFDSGRRRNKTVSLDDPETIGDARDGLGGTQPDRLAMRAELRERLVQAVGRLTPEERAVWTAIEIEGLTFRELAEEWQEPLGTLLSRKSRATAKLRRLLADDQR